MENLTQPHSWRYLLRRVCAKITSFFLIIRYFLTILTKFKLLKIKGLKNYEWINDKEISQWSIRTNNSVNAAHFSVYLLYLHEHICDMWHKYQLKAHKQKAGILFMRCKYLFHSLLESSALLNSLVQCYCAEAGIFSPSSSK